MIDSKREIVLAKLRKIPGLTAPELEDELPTIMVRTVLSSAARRGAVVVDGSTKRPRFYARDAVATLFDVE